MTSLAWRLKESRELIPACSLSEITVHMCMYRKKEEPDLCTKKATKLVGNLPDLSRIAQTCDRQHTHAPPLRGERAARAAAYPLAFCEAVADAVERAYLCLQLGSPSESLWGLFGLRMRSAPSLSR